MATTQIPKESSSLEIQLKRADKIYRPNERLEGVVVVHAKNGWTTLNLFPNTGCHKNAGLTPYKTDVFFNPFLIQP